MFSYDGQNKRAAFPNHYYFIALNPSAHQPISHHQQNLCRNLFCHRQTTPTTTTRVKMVVEKSLPPSTTPVITTEEHCRIAFEPADIDVVCTKLRTWNCKHPGNLVFNQAMGEKIPLIQHDRDFRIFAENLIETVLQRGGRFLKLDDKDCRGDGLGHLRPKLCAVMTQKQMIHRVLRSLRTAHAKFHGTMPPRAIGSSSKSKTKQPFQQQQQQQRQQQQQEEESKRYQARAGKHQPVHPHALEMISLVCNIRTGQNAYRVLDTPVLKFTIDTEPEKERRMRLQVRIPSPSQKRFVPMFRRLTIFFWFGVIYSRSDNDTHPPRQGTYLQSNFHESSYNYGGVPLSNTT